MASIARALRHPDYRLYFAGQIVSLVGTWMQQIAMGWLAYRLSGSPFVLGLVGFSAQIPVLVLSPIGGLLSDRVDRRRLLILTQGAALLQASVLAALTLAHLVQPWHLVALALVLGSIHAIDIPARQSFFVHLVRAREDLPNAIALNSFTMNTARFVGPAIGGAVVAAIGEGACFLVNALTYFAVLAALVAIRARTPARPGIGVLAALAEGFRAAFGTAPMRTLLGLVAAISFCVTPYSVLMPIFAREVFGGDAGTLGLLMACAGGGAMLGTLVLAARRSVVGLERSIAFAALGAGFTVIAFSASGSLLVAAPALVLAGFAVISVVASSNTVVQTLVSDELRGRVMSLFAMSFLGIAPIGALAAGAAAEAIGAPLTLACGGMAATAAGMWFLRRRRIVGEAIERAVSGGQDSPASGR